MDVVATVIGRGGIALSAGLVTAGVKGHLIAKAIAAGDLVRVRRRWVAVRDADAVLVAAARAGVVVSCVTQAKRLGLWVLDDLDHTHVAARPHAGRIIVPKRTTVHWAEPLVARSPATLEDPIENVLAAVALCQPHERALAIFESALRKQRIDPLAFGRLALTGKARALLAAAQPFSDSGLETFVVPRLRWMDVRIVAQVRIADHRVDFLIGERFVLQIDGGHHVGAQRTSDIRHDAQLMLMGYHVVRVGYDQVVNDWPSVQDVIMRAIAQGLHRAA